MRVLWLRPSKGDNISVRRERIAEYLETQGFEVVIKDATGIDLLAAAWTAIWGDFDVIAGNVRVGLYAGYPLARLLRKPFLGDVSDPISDIDYLPEPLFRFFEWYEWKVLERADATVFVYESSYQEAKSRGIDALKLPNAVNFEQFADPDETAVKEANSILSASGIEFNHPIAIYLGVFNEGYCIDAILDAARETPTWEFVFLGEGPLANDVEAHADSHENIHYPGAFRYDLMPGFLAHADVGFCFKDAEQPLKLKEYGAAGIPAIVRPGELSKWYSEDELIFVKPEGQSISKTLTELATDEQRRQEYAKKLQEHASEYSWAEVGENYAELLNQLAN